MKRIIRFFLSVLIWFFSTVVLLLFGGLFINETSDGTLVMPGWCVVIVLVIPITLVILYLKGKLKLSKKIIEEVVQRDGSITNEEKDVSENTAESLDRKPPSVKIPWSRKKRTAIVQRLLTESKACAKIASEATEVYQFEHCWEKMISNIEMLILFEGKVSFPGVLPSQYLIRLNSEHQWKLKDAIERGKNAAISDIKKLYKNSHEHQVLRCEKFEHDISLVRFFFEGDTESFANDAVKQVRDSAGLGTYENSFSSENISEIVSITEVDLMDGHQFEQFCAALLSKNGFQEITVTAASGDQGVDILAEKGGIKYAIQCKCYASDLGNTPIQEVHAGKAIYHCHVGVVMTNRHFISGAKEAAKAIGVLLWDRDSLSTMIAETKD